MTSVEELALRCLFPGFEGSEAPDWVRRRVASGLGGVVLFARNVDAPEQLTALSDALHGEHSGLYEYDLGNHFLVNANTKFVWWSQTGREQLFDLANDPNELHDLALAPDGEARVEPWRRRLAQRLRDRPEGCSDGERLIAGKPHEQMVPQPAPVPVAS